MAETRRCWCGSDDLRTFDDRYLSCRKCETLLVAVPPLNNPARVDNDDEDFYGRRYWFEHQQGLGQPDLEARSVADLSERCLHWLRTVLKYRLPPGRTLELGCAHGGFVNLLAGTGFEATGLELSPWVVDFARHTFEVPVLLGPLEDQDLEPGSLDVIAAMDVLEHLPDPEATMRRCVELLSDDGVLLVQTPCRPAGKSLENLTAAGDRFVEMLLPAEHLQLFSRQAAAELFKRAGAPHLTFEPALFAHYDMFLAVGKRPLRTNSPAAVRAALTATASGRRILAMLDLHRLAERRAETFHEADRDRRERQQQIDELHGLLGTDRQERRQTERLLREEIDALREGEAATLETVIRLESAQAQSAQAVVQLEKERTEAREKIEQLEAAQAQYRQSIEELESERTEAQEKIEKLEAAQAQHRQSIEELESERTETAAAIEDLEGELSRSQETMEELHEAIAQLDDDRTQARQAVEHLRQERQALERDEIRLRATVAEQTATVQQHRDEIAALRRQQAELAEIHRRAVGTIEAQDGAHADLARDAARLRRHGQRREQQLRELRELVEEHRTSRIYKTLVLQGRWRPYEEKLRRVLDGGGEDSPAGNDDEVVWDFTVIAESTSGAIAAAEEAPAIAVDLTALLPGGENGGAKLVATALVRRMSHLAPDRPIVLLTSEPCHRELAALDSDNVRRLQVRAEPAALGDVLRHQPLSLLLCPMTAPPFADPRVPLICVVHDLQYQAYPEFFSSEERATRDRDFRRAVEVADMIVTVSEYVRRTVIDSSGLDPGRVVAIHNGLAQQLPETAEGRAGDILVRHGLEPEHFLLYPANFWPHKNHRMLLAAFGRFCHRRPDAEIKLVLTGADRPDPGPIREAARVMGLGDAVVFPGFVPEDELAVLMRSCLALIFPSLYEGFGMPVVEAMACGRPVLASDAASIPEVAGDAAWLFDPRKPEEITAAIERLLDEPDRAAELSGKGPARARRIADTERMAGAYLEVIDGVLATPRPARDGLFGVHGDGWTAARFIVSHSTPPPPPEDKTASPRTLEMELISPPGSAAHPLTLTARSSSGETYRASLAGRPRLRLRCRLPAAAGWIELEVEPPFTPAARGVNDDARELGLKLQQCRLIDDGGAVDLLP